MIAVLPLLFIGALTFVEQNIADDVTAEFRHADLDHDGSMDLVLPNAVYFQRNGGFSRENRVPLPDIREPSGMPICDVWNDTLFILSNTRLYLIRWENGVWQTVHSQPLTWPHNPEKRPEAGAPPSPPQQTQAGQELHLHGFLHDINGDGVPEIVIPGEDGLRIYSREEQGYVEASKLDVFPALQVEWGWLSSQALWPETDRKLVFPKRYTECGCNLSGNRLTLFTQERLRDFRIRYRVKRYELGQEFAPVPEKTCEDVTEPLPPSFCPRMHGEDGRIEYAGAKSEDSEASAMRWRILEASTTSDGGKTFQGIRSVSSWLVDGFADLDGDGRLDIATCTSDLFDGGIRETVARVLTSLELHEEVRIYLRDPSGTFPDKPSIMFPFTVKLDAPLAMERGPRSYGDTCSLRGDFDGDKRCDLLVERSSDELAIHLFEGDSFGTTPKAVLALNDEEDYAISDLDGDGRSDIILTMVDYTRDEPTRHSRVFLSRETAP